MDNMGRFWITGWLLIIVPGPGAITAEEILACYEGLIKWLELWALGCLLCILVVKLFDISRNSLKGAVPQSTRPPRCQSTIKYRKRKTQLIHNVHAHSFICYFSGLLDILKPVCRPKLGFKP